LLVPVADGTMIVASDYSGQHKEASHEAYSFLVTVDQALKEWLPLLAAFRERWLPDNRRISFKKLNEPVRRRAFPAFLETAGKLRGNLVTGLEVSWLAGQKPRSEHFRTASPFVPIVARWKRCFASQVSLL
jgi:hypothetical protein